MRMFKIVMVAIVALAVATILGWVGWFSGVANSVHQALFGAPLAHPQGSTADHLNDWLTFLPDDALTRGVVVCGFIVGLIVLSFIVNILAIRLSRWRARRAQEREARIRTMNSYHKS
jgi:amino acid transporter